MPRVSLPMSPFLTHLGARATSPHPGELAPSTAAAHHVDLALQDAHANRFGAAHGGVTMALLDAAMALAARQGQPEGVDCVTIEMKTSFFQPAKGQLRASGQVLHRTPTLVFTQGELRDASGALCAQASGTFKPLRFKPGPPA